MTDDSGSDTDGYPGQQTPGSAYSTFNRNSFDNDQALKLVRTMVPVKIMDVHADPDGGPPTIDVQPLIKMTDVDGTTSSHGTVYGIATHRHQAGDFAIISDPVKDDIGFMSVADRDITALKASKQESQPGSARTFDLADGVYHGQMLNKAPKHSLEVKRDSSGNVTSLNLTSPAGLNFNGVTIDKDGNLKAPGEVTAQSNGGSVSLSTHLHPETSKPTPGT